MIWEIDIGVAMNDEFSIFHLMEVMDPWKQYLESSGAGFGVRDMQFVFDSEPRAHVEFPKIRQAILNEGYELEYAGVNGHPETKEEMREQGWSEEDIKDYYREAE